jgi:hypothetical protein
MPRQMCGPEKRRSAAVDLVFVRAVSRGDQAPHEWIRRPALPPFDELMSSGAQLAGCVLITDWAASGTPANAIKGAADERHVRPLSGAALLAQQVPPSRTARNSSANRQSSSMRCGALDDLAAGLLRSMQTTSTKTTASDSPTARSAACCSCQWESDASTASPLH